MKKIFKRGISILLIIMMLLSSTVLFTSCDNSPANNSPQKNYENYYSATPKENIEQNEFGKKYVNNELVVIAKENVTKAQMQELAVKYEAEIVGYIEITGDYQWRLKKTYSYEELQNILKNIQAEEIVENATLQTIFETDMDSFVVPNDTRWKNEWDGENPSGENWGIEAIYAPYAWKYTEYMTPIRLGLIDGMFNTTNNDLRFAEVLYNPEQTAITSDHGTHVAGTMAAIYNNGEGITGVYPFGVNSDGSSNLYGIAWNGTENSDSTFFWKSSYAHLVSQNVKVINMSVGYGKLYMFLATKGYTEVQDDIKKDAEDIGKFLNKLIAKGFDFVITKSAGNTRDTHFKKTGDSKTYPYGWEMVSSGGETGIDGLADWGYFISAANEQAVKDRIIVVGAAEKTAKSTYDIASFSNTGSRVDVMAPGVDITSFSYGNAYEAYMGTSMAAPHVAGAATTVWAFNPGLSGALVKNILVETATTKVNGTDVKMINLLEALRKAAETRTDGNPFANEKAVVAATVMGGGKQLKGAKVEVYDANTNNVVATCTTSDDGSFKAELPSGNYYLIASAAGYANAKIEDISVSGGQRCQLDDIMLGELVTNFTIPSEMVVTLGEVEVIEPDIAPADAAGFSIKWTSSDESVATVSPTGEAGVITTLKKGTATITAELTSGDKVITKSTKLRVASKARDTVLVLDVSGSMYGQPMEEMKKSAIKFCNDLLKDNYNNRVGIVFYDHEYTTIDLTNDIDMLISNIESISDGGRTDIEAALAAADRMLQKDSKPEAIKNVVVMADGIPNEGKRSNSGSMPSGNYYVFDSSVQNANAVIDTAKEMQKRYNMYSLGFFHNLYAEEKEFGVALMKALASKEEDYYQVDKAEDLQFAFGDISEDINVGSKIVINIACPVDVKVSYGGETLSSASDSFNGNTSFGTLHLLGKNKDIKVVSVDSDKDYDIEITGTDTGKMDYSVNYFDENEQLVDFRSFESVPVSKGMKIKSTTNKKEKDIQLEIDENGDGETDTIWTAMEKGKGSITYEKNPKPDPQPEPAPKPEPAPAPSTTKNSDWAIVLICAFVFMTIIGGVVMAVVFTIVSSNRREDDNFEIPVIDNNKPETKAPVEISEERITEDGIRSSGVIQITNGSMNGCSFPIKDGETIYIGKDAKYSNIVLSSEYKNVSRVHCAVSYSAKTKKYYVTDCSSNGTYFISKERLEKGRRTPIDINTCLLLANEKCTILLG